MLPVAVIPIHDPPGTLFPHLAVITPALKTLFAQVFISINVITQQTQPEQVAKLEADPFFQVTKHKMPMPIGEEFSILYANAASACAPTQVLHLCFPDRVAFALQSKYSREFIADIQAVTPSQTPLLFQRSATAWQTHPRNYYDLEQMVTQAGSWLFGKSLDFAWCHIALQAQQLQHILPQIRHSNATFGFFAQFVLALREQVATQDVDWLAWEDPFILSRDAQTLKAERETDLTETYKRLSYVIPMLQLLDAASKYPIME